MSNNVSHIEILQSEGFRIHRTELSNLARAFEGRCAECCFLEEESNPDVFTPAANDYLIVKRVWWGGEFSGSSIDILLDNVLPSFEGTADLVISFEDGSKEGCRLQNHKVTRMKVVLTLA